MIGKDLLGIESLSAPEIEIILKRGFLHKNGFFTVGKPLPLQGKTVATLFYEPSTRTRTSFELAAKRLGADVVSLAIAQSSVQKGESLKDTGMTLNAMGIDAAIIRHQMSGAPALLARYMSAAVINAGDGTHEHPTQALLDAMTIMQYKKEFKGLKVAIVGDILHSRVARSNMILLGKMGAEVTVCGPATLLPKGLQAYEATVTTDIEEALQGKDVVMALRIQLERQQKGLFPSISEYFRLYGIDTKKMQLAAKDAILMHPGPVNRGVEISSEATDAPYSVILDQVTNGLAIRMALLEILTGGELRIENIA